VAAAAPEDAAAAVPPSAPAPTDTCTCSLRGTVEVHWDDRPLEEDFLVVVDLDGPTRRSVPVEMDMGSPREFRVGPLQCGRYQLSARPQGRLRYTLAGGDSVMTVPCRGSSQARMVLVPAKR
jgi:hypothetical protein